MGGDQRIAIGNRGVARLFVLYIIDVELLLLALSSRSAPCTVSALSSRGEEKTALMQIWKYYTLQDETPSRLCL